MLPKGRRQGDNGVTINMLRLVPVGVLKSHRGIANAAILGGRIPGSWKRGVMFPIGKQSKGR